MKPSAKLCRKAGLALGFFLGALTAHAQPARNVSVFALNDFHGHLQATAPVPALVRALQADQPPRRTGGLAYVHGVLDQLRAKHPHHLLVGVGDMMGASPADAALLDEQPAIESLNRLGLSLSSLGNHELDYGPTFLANLLAGACAPSCKLPGFAGAKFEYLAANVKTANGATPSWLKRYALREVGGHTVAFIGAVTRSTPRFLRPAFTQGLVFEDEAEAINRTLVEVRAHKPSAIVVLMHEGAEIPRAAPITGAAPAAQPSDCATLRGPALEIARAVDQDVRAFFTGHTHQTYACELEGRFFVQGGAHGAHVSEIQFQVNAQGQLLPHSALLHITAHEVVRPDAQSEAFVRQVQSLTVGIKQEVIGHLPAPLLRADHPCHGDSPLGRWVADAFLQAGRVAGGADLAFTNASGIRANLGEQSTRGDRGLAIVRADLMASLPFRNELVVLTLSGSQLLDVLSAQTDTLPGNRVRILQPSSNLNYSFDRRRPAAKRVTDVRLNGQPIDPQRSYRVVFNSFIADGAESFGLLKHVAHREPLGVLDIDAAMRSLQAVQPDWDQLQTGRVLLP